MYCGTNYSLVNRFKNKDASVWRSIIKGIIEGKGNHGRESVGLTILRKRSHFLLEIILNRNGIMLLHVVFHSFAPRAASKQSIASLKMYLCNKRIYRSFRDSEFVIYRLTFWEYTNAPTECILQETDGIRRIHSYGLTSLWNSFRFFWGLRFLESSKCCRSRAKISFRSFSASSTSAKSISTCLWCSQYHTPSSSMGLAASRAPRMDELVLIWHRVPSDLVAKHCLGGALHSVNGGGLVVVHESFNRISFGEPWYDAWMPSWMVASNNSKPLYEDRGFPLGYQGISIQQGTW